MKNDSFKINIGWLYPDLMSTYGDRGNITVLQKRCEWRGISTSLVRITSETDFEELKKADFIFGGGAQDREQEIVMEDMKRGKGNVLKSLIESDIPALFVCGSPQLMGNFYEPAEGKRIEGVGIFDMVTRHPGQGKKRLIGNIAVEVIGSGNVVVGFENHGGRTYLGKTAKPFAKVLKGFGNNGEDGTEGVVYKNAIGTYLHGPLLPKNPMLADYFIQKALEVKYNEKVELGVLDDDLENKAREAILKKLKVNF